MAARVFGVAAMLLVCGWPSNAAHTSPAQVPAARGDELRGAYGRYRANNDLLSYHLDIRVDPTRKFITGRNTIGFRMLASDTRIQLDLHAALNVDGILFRAAPLKFERVANTVFVDFPETLQARREYTIEFAYSGMPQEFGRFGGFTFRKDPAGRPWIVTACEDVGASVWWPSKDQWRDEVERMQISVAVPNGLIEVSNGTLRGTTDLKDGYTRWDWLVQYPINAYDVVVNIGQYAHFADRLRDLRLDFYVLPENLENARRQFAQVKPMLDAYQHYFGDYPFKKDGYKLVEAPYAGMEHQSAIAYGNQFQNGYLQNDWTGTGLSSKFDFIIVHESAHEWFGNSVSAADVSDMWLHEGWATYLECLYVEQTFGELDARRYVNAYKSKVQNRLPIITARGLHLEPPQDMYFKGALFLNTLRNVVNITPAGGADDARWWTLIRNYYQHFKYTSILTEDVIRFFNRETRRDLTPIFNQYLRHPSIPTLELQFRDDGHTVAYRWLADEPAFAMPVRVGRPEAWQVIEPTTQWKTMSTSLKSDAFDVATDLYYVNVSRQ